MLPLLQMAQSSSRNGRMGGCLDLSASTPGFGSLFHVFSSLARELGRSFVGLGLVGCIAAAIVIQWKERDRRDRTLTWAALVGVGTGVAIWTAAAVAMTVLVGLGYPTEDADRLSTAALVVAVILFGLMAALATIVALRERALRKQNAGIAAVFQSLPVALSLFDSEQRLIMCNSTYRLLNGLCEADARPGTAYSDVSPEHVHREKSVGGQIHMDVSQVWHPLGHAKSSDCGTFTETLHLRDGRTIVRKVGPIAGGGWIEVQEDITALRRSDERMEWLARHDVLTGIANRHQFREQLEQEFARYDPRLGFALHWIDLDCFKGINDTYGHPVGDAFLKSVASRLATSLRAGDLVGRLGGDEFAILQKGAGRKDLAQEFAGRILSTIARPHDALGHRLQANASIGIALAPAHGSNVDQLFANADAALYQAKSGGRGVAKVYEASVANLSATNPLSAELALAVANDELVLHYQPITDLETGQVTSFEALMRWRHPSRGMLPPSEFIALAEETGLIIRMGVWALERACLDCRTWPEDVSVAVNLSAVQIEGGDLYETVRDALVTSGLDPQRLQLEITESDLVRDRARTRGVLRKLSALGVAIALDDFGTRFASFDYLRHFPLSKLKIDRSFVRDLPNDRNCATIVKSITELAHELGMRVVVEGVETAANLCAIHAAGCDAAQGFYFSPPVPARAVARTLSRCKSRLGHADGAAVPTPSDLVA